MTLRIRTNVAWALRSLAKRLNARADVIDPIKLTTFAELKLAHHASYGPVIEPHPNAELVTIVQSIARDAIQRAARPHVARR